MKKLFLILVLLINGGFLLHAQSPLLPDKNGHSIPKGDILKSPSPGSFQCGTSSISDYDGNPYATILIGHQCWMKINLRTTHYSNGDIIPNITLAGDWDGLTTTDEAYALFGNSLANGETYGALYTWAAAMNGAGSGSGEPSGVQGACPTNWHVPSDYEWGQLEAFLGMSASDVYALGWRGAGTGGALKSTTGWTGANTGATNGSGFSALPGSCRNACGEFFNLGMVGHWWTSTEEQSSLAYFRKLETEQDKIYRQRTYTDYGFSVRCVWDQFYPKVTTAPGTNITGIGASTGGNISSDGGFAITARGVCWNTTGTPTISDSYTSDGTGTGSFISTLTGLSSPTTYYVRAYATNSLGTSYGNEVEITIPFVCGTSTVKDYDDNVYNTVEIGSQCWMKEDMKTTHYADGTALVDGTSAGDITGDYTTKYWFVYGNNPANKTTYGLLYTWAAAMNGATSSISNPSGVQGVCPAGWHLPGDSEWTQLENALGGSSVAGSKLKEAGNAHWNGPNADATNTSGFTALPGGNRDNDGSFYNLSYTGYWWSATESNGSMAWFRYLYPDYAQVYRHSNFKLYGFSVRCLMDN